jgi:hypothetical protein
MSCLAHDKRFRSLFHNIINELRNEKRIPVSILRSMPSKCCTCNDENKETIKSVIMKEENQFTKLRNLNERVNREKETNPKLILSLNRFKNIIEGNQGPAPVLSESLSVPKQEESRSSSDDGSSSSGDSSSSSGDSSSSSDSEDFIPMEICNSPVRYRKKHYQKIYKTPKPIKNGTFLFLPYACEKKTGRKKSNSSLLDVAKELQRRRFISRNGHIAVLEKQYGVRINMITPKTSEQVIEALENAKKGLDKLTIHDKKESMRMSEKHEGEWVLIRSKKPQNQTNTANMEELLDDLTNRWENCLNIKKRKNDEADSSDDSVHQKKK